MDRKGVEYPGLDCFRPLLTTSGKRSALIKNEFFLEHQKKDELNQGVCSTASLQKVEV